MSSPFLTTMYYWYTFVRRWISTVFWLSYFFLKRLLVAFIQQSFFDVKFYFAVSDKFFHCLFFFHHFCLWKETNFYFLFIYWSIFFTSLFFLFFIYFIFFFTSEKQISVLHLHRNLCHRLFQQRCITNIPSIEDEFQQFFDWIIFKRLLVVFIQKIFFDVKFYFAVSEKFFSFITSAYEKRHTAFLFYFPHFFHLIIYPFFFCTFYFYF